MYVGTAATNRVYEDKMGRFVALANLIIVKARTISYIEVRP